MWHLFVWIEKVSGGRVQVKSGVGKNWPEFGKAGDGKLSSTSDSVIPSGGWRPETDGSGEELEDVSVKARG